MDLTAAIMAALGQKFLTTLQQGCPPGDVLQLATLREVPLQDDPTLVAPYLIYGPDHKRGITADKTLPGEIGGGVWLNVWFNVVVGTPLATSRIMAYTRITELLRRVRQCLLLDPTLGGLTASEYGLEPVHPMFITGCFPRIYGGETTWYGEGLVSFAYTVEEQMFQGMVYNIVE